MTISHLDSSLDCNMLCVYKCCLNGLLFVFKYNICYKLMFASSDNVKNFVLESLPGLMARLVWAIHLRSTWPGEKFLERGRLKKQFFLYDAIFG